MNMITSVTYQGKFVTYTAVLMANKVPLVGISQQNVICCAYTKIDHESGLANGGLYRVRYNASGLVN